MAPKKLQGLDAATSDDAFVWTGGGDGTSYDDPNNWDDTTTGDNPATRAPDASDDVTIDSAGDLTGSGAASQLTFSGTNTDLANLSIDTGFASGDLSIESGGMIAAGTGFEQDSGNITIGMSGSLTTPVFVQDDGTLTVADGGTFSATGSVENAGTIIVNAMVSVSTPSYLQFGGDTTISGTLNATAGTDAILSHDGLFTITAGGTVSTTSFVQVYSFDEPFLVMEPSSGMTASGGQSSYQPDDEPPIGVDIEGSGLVDDANLDSSAGFVVVGDEGGGAILTDEDGGTVTASFTTIGPYDGDDGTLSVTGSGSKYTDLAGIFIGGGADAGFAGGDGGNGMVMVANGGTLVETTDAVIASSASSTGTVTVDGSGSQWTMRTLTVGDAGTGTLAITNAASVSASTLVVAAQSGSGSTSNPDSITVDGASSAFTVSGTATVDSATPTNDGSGGVWNYTSSGIGQITVSNGGYLSIGQTLSLLAPGDTTLPSVLTVVSGGGVEVGGNNGAIADTLYIDNGGLVIGHGTIASINTSTDPALPAWSLNVVDNGTIEAKQGKLTIDGNITANGTVQVDNDATLELGGSFAQGGTVSFASTDQHTLVLDDPTEFNGALTGVAPGDQIVIPNSSLTNGASVIAAPIVQMDGTQTLLIYEGSSIIPTVVLPNIPIQGPAGSTSLAGDYFQIAQDGSNDVLTLVNGNQPGFIINSGYSDTVATLGTTDNALQMNFEIGVETAVLFYQSEITNSMTANITFGWGDAGPDAVTGNNVGRSYWFYNTYSYAALRAALATTYAGSAVQNAALASLPVADPTGGTMFAVTFAEQKALGLLGTTTAADGYVGLNTSDNYFWAQGTPNGGYDAVGDFEHEISEVMGRNAEGGAPSGQPLQPLDLFRYTAADGGATDGPGAMVGERDEPFVADWVGGAGPLARGQAGINANSYFSFNGQNVTLPFDTPADVAAGADVGDWGPSVLGDPYGYFRPGAVEQVSNTGLQVMNVLGYNIPTVLACYAAGTRILTDRGEVPVQDLRIGDLVQTVSRQIAAPIEWIGHRNVNCARHPDPRQVWPVRVRAGAFDDAMPHRDLWLSPDHAVYVRGVLIPIRHLINGTSIAQLPVAEVTYYHIELPGHDVVLAEGMPAETYLDTGGRWRFARSAEVVSLARSEPNAVAIWEAHGCAPLIVAGPTLDAVRHDLAARAWDSNRVRSAA